jgi:hypothetical protein
LAAIRVAARHCRRVLAQIAALVDGVGNDGDRHHEDGGSGSQRRK